MGQDLLVGSMDREILAIRVLEFVYAYLHSLRVLTVKCWQESLHVRLSGQVKHCGA